MSNRADRHKAPRIYLSGAQKRKLVKERTTREKEVIAKTRCLKEFLTMSEKPCKIPEDIEPSSSSDTCLLELIAEYDDFLKHHIQVHGNQGSGHTNYLSSTICEEFIQLLSDRVFQEIVLRIKKLRYYSISLDSTSDKSHVDQLTLIFRYIENVKPVERFVKFMPNQGHKAQDMFNCVMRFLEDHEIDVKNCRGHSLNLVGLAAAECCPDAIDFFDFLEKIYVFFTASSSRYDLLIQALKSTKDVTFQKE
nr:PREDICTED: uncharacterized protein LOC105678085 [Linepithema humile]